jgi:protein STE50
MSLFEQDLRRLTDDFRRLREDMLPALRLAKDAQQPLPTNPNNNDVYTFEASTLSPPAPTPSSTQSTSNINIRRYNSTRKIALGQPPKNSSPTHLQTSHFVPEQTLDPSPAAERAVQQSALLTAMQNGSGQSTSPIFPSPNIPSPTSPPSYGTSLPSRSYRSPADAPPSSTRTTFPESDHKPIRAPGRQNTPAPDTPSSSNASVEIFKSFRVSMEDPCYKVLPAALRKYRIDAPWDQYALYIVYGDQERCLGLDEKPLILFKQLDREGKKPMFMLRKTNNAQVDLTSDMPPGSAGLSASARGAATEYDPPGGII